MTQANNQSIKEVNNCSIGEVVFNVDPQFTAAVDLFAKKFSRPSDSVSVVGSIAASLMIILLIVAAWYCLTKQPERLF